MEDTKCCCNDFEEEKEYFEVTWTKVWPDGHIDGGSINTDRNVDSMESFINEIIRPMCRGVSFTDGTIDKYIDGM